MDVVPCRSPIRLRSSTSSRAPCSPPQSSTTSRPSRSSLTSGARPRRSTPIRSSRAACGDRSPPLAARWSGRRADRLMAKRKERVAPPPAPSGWDFRFASSDAAKGWDQVFAAAPANARRALDRITVDPRDRDDRQHPLEGALSTGSDAPSRGTRWPSKVKPLVSSSQSGTSPWRCVAASRNWNAASRTRWSRSTSTDRHSARGRCCSRSGGPRVLTATRMEEISVAR